RKTPLAQAPPAVDPRDGLRECDLGRGTHRQRTETQTRHPGFAPNGWEIPAGWRLQTRTRSVTPLSNSFEKMLSLSWITNRYGWSPGSASRNCCRVHSAVG